MTAVFTYGTLMFPQVWCDVLKGADAKSSPARITGFARFRVRDENFPAMLRQTGAQLSGVLYQPVSASELAILDAFEGDDYQRITVFANPLNEPSTLIKAYAYLCLCPDKIERQAWDVDHFGQHELRSFIQAHVLR